MIRELRKDVTMLLKNKRSLTGVIEYLLKKNIEPNEIIKELAKRHYDVDYVKRILWMDFHITTHWDIILELGGEEAEYWRKKMLWKY